MMHIAGSHLTLPASQSLMYPVSRAMPCESTPRRSAYNKEFAAVKACSSLQPIFLNTDWVNSCNVLWRKKVSSMNGPRTASFDYLSEGKVVNWFCICGTRSIARSCNTSAVCRLSSRCGSAAAEQLHFAYTQGERNALRIVLPVVRPHLW